MQVRKVPLVSVRWSPYQFSPHHTATEQRRDSMSSGRGSAELSKMVADTIAASTAKMEKTLEAKVSSC